MSVIGILSSTMEKWHNGSVLAHYCCLRLASLLCLCVFFLHRRKTSLLPLWRPASCASLQDCPRRLVNIGNTKPLTTSLLCLEDCHDNTEWISWRAGVLVRWMHTEICPSTALLQGRAAIAYALSVTPPKWEASHCRDTEVVKDRNSLLDLTACLILKECLDKNLN